MCKVYKHFIQYNHYIFVTSVIVSYYKLIYTVLRRCAYVYNEINDSNRRMKM